MRGDEMRKFWDRRADENALYYVDNRLQFSNPDTEQFWQAGEQDLDKLLEIAGVAIAAEDEVVEIGCGVGRLTRVIADRARAVQAIDVSDRMLELAREFNPALTGVRWLQGDGLSLRPIGDETADLCVSHVVFQHIPDPAITLGYVREIGRVLRPGGRAAFQVSNLPPSRHAAGGRRRIVTLRERLGRGPRGQDHPAWRGSAVDLDQLAAVAAEAGMSVQNIAGRGTQFCIVTLRKP